MAGYGYSPYSWPMNNPISFNDPNGDIAPLVALGIIAVGGGIVNTASNWGKIGSFTEGLNYFVTGAAGYGVGVVNPVAGGSILAGGNLLIGGIYGDLPSINNFGDFVGIATSTVLDFAGPYTIGGSLSSTWAKFNASGALTNSELTILTESGLRSSIKEAAGT